MLDRERAVGGRLARRISPSIRLQTASSPPAPAASKVGGLARTPGPRPLDVWQRRTNRPLSAEDGRQIRENLCGFFDLLADWDRAERRGPANVRNALAPLS